MIYVQESQGNLVNKMGHPVEPWRGPSMYRGWTISCPWQDSIGGPFTAQVYALPGATFARVSGSTPEACWRQGKQYIDTFFA